VGYARTTDGKLGLRPGLTYLISCIKKGMQEVVLQRPAALGVRALAYVPFFMQLTVDGNRYGEKTVSDLAKSGQSVADSGGKPD
jgi:hypothetical protein